MSLFENAFRRSLETEPVTYESVMATMEGPMTDAGIRVSPKTALKLSTVFACIRVISETLGSLPLHLYRRLERGRERERTGLARILGQRPNPQMTAMTFWELLASHVVGWGNAFAEIEFNRAGEVVALWPLLPDRTRAVRVKGKKLIRTSVLEDGRWIQGDLPAHRVLHIPGPGFDGLNGYSVLTLARQAIGLGLAAERFGARLFGSGTHPDVVVSHPKSLTDEAAQRIERGIRQFHSGLDRSHRMLLLEEGMELQKVGLSNEDSQFIQTRRLTAEDIARFFRVPPHMVGILDRATFSNIEHQGIDFVKHTVRPWCCRFEQAIAAALLTEEEAQELFAEFLLDGLLRGDFEARMKGLATAVQNGWMSRNEVRALENLNPIPGEGGDAYTVQLNMASLESVVGFELEADLRSLAAHRQVEPLREVQPEALREIQPEPPPESSKRELRQRRSVEARRRAREAFRPAVGRSASRWVNREARMAQRLLQRIRKEGTPEAFLEAMESVWEGVPSHIDNEMRPVLTSLAEMVAGELRDEVGPPIEGFEISLAAFLVAYVEGYAARHVGSSRRQLRRIVEAEGEAWQSLEERLAEWTEKRPGRIARDETIRAEGAVSREIYGQTPGVTRLRWLEVGKSCPLCNQLSGRVVGVRESFVEPGETVVGEGAEGAEITVKGPIAHAPLHRGCDCLIVAD